MNSLSWFIYLADVIHNVGNLAGLMSFVGFIGGVTLFIAFMMLKATASDPNDFHYEVAKGVLPSIRFTMKIWYPLWALFLLVSTFAPSRNTMYMIAASEAGQMIIDNKGTQEIVGDIKDIITDKLKKMKEGK